MTRDRLAELKSKIPDDGNVFITMAIKKDNVKSQEEFVFEIEVLKSQIDVLEKNVQEMTKLQTMILSSATSNDNLKSQLYGLMNESKDVSSKIRLKITQFDEDLQKLAKDLGTDSAEFRIRNNQYRMILKMFLDIMTEYNTIQIDYRERCKDRIQRQLEITGRQTTKDELETMLESGNPAIFTEGIVTDTKQALESLREIEARHKDILKLESSIRELNEMFLEMAALIRGQGEMVDVIQRQVEQTKDFVSNAQGQLNEALVNKSKAARKKLLCYSILAIVLILLFFSLFSDFGK